MNLKNVMVELDASQVQEILRIEMDEDAGEALAFIYQTESGEAGKSGASALLSAGIRGRLRPRECGQVMAPDNLEFTILVEVR